MIPKDRPFDASRDSVWFRQTLDLAAHLGIVIPEPVKGVLAEIAIEMEAELDRRYERLKRMPPPPIVVDGREFRYVGPKIVDT